MYNENYSKKTIIDGLTIYISTFRCGESKEEQLEFMVKNCKKYPAFKTPEGQTGEMALSKEDAIDLAIVVATCQLDKKPSDEECYQMALPLLKKYYPQYVDETKPESVEEEKEEASKMNLKEIVVLDSCSLCGLCDQEELSDVFTYDANGKLTVRHGGVIDVEKLPKVLEVAELCPEKAIQVNEVKELSQEDASKVLDQFNRFINDELRNFPLNVPAYYEYEYESDIYEALPVPAKYRSDRKYLTDGMAENAGFSEFTKAVYSQVKNITKQYVVAYKVKKLQQFYVYEETSGNYYYQINLKITSLLEKAYQMAQTISKYQLSVPSTFCNFSVKPSLDSFSCEILKKLEDKDFHLAASGFFHIEDHYRTWVNTDEVDGKYCYDFTEAEQQLREDIDLAIRDIMEQYVVEEVTYLVNDYNKRVQAELAERLTLLQTEAKRFTPASSGEEFTKKIKEFCNAVLQAMVPSLRVPYIENFDTTYNDSPRFTSLRACEKAAGNRRERAYNDGYRFLEGLPRHLENSWTKEIAETLTEWKRQLLSIYDLCGRSYPIQPAKIQIGNRELEITLRDHNEVSVDQDRLVKDYVDIHITGQACYGTIDGKSYASEYDCDIDTDYDCDFKETFFGDIKEVNKRYRYFLNLHIFEISCREMSRAATKVLEDSDFMKTHFSDIKKAFVTEIHRITGV